MKHFFILFSFLLILSNFNAHAKTRNVLFIGNSYTGVNNLPNIVQGISTSMGDTLVYDSYTPGGKTANGHWNDATTIAKISQGGWDYVILQFQSQEPSFSPGQVSTQTYPYAKSLDSLVKATNSCAEVLYYMTWGRKNGDAGNCANYPPVCTYEGMQQRLRESYLLFAQDFNSSVAPVGVAWKTMRNSFPLVDLYSADESHPSVNGSFLTACVFYTSIFNKSCVSNQFLLGGVGNSDAQNMQAIASNTVLDSLENWQGNGAIPKAAFTFTTGQNNATFTNTSQRYQNSSWNFGDGTPINNNQSPFHLFPTTTGGTYNVCLTITNPCGKTDFVCQSVTLGAISVNNFEESKELYFYNNTLSWSDNIKIDLIEVFNSLGQKVLKIQIRSNQRIQHFKLTNGVYIIRAKTAQGKILNHKVIITS